MAKNDNGMDNQVTLDTSMYNKNTPAGEITEEGIVFFFDDIKEYEGRFEVEQENEDGSVSKVKKPFWVISGFDEHGLDMTVTFGSSKLHRMVMDNFKILKGSKIKLCGRGKNFSREYTITILR